ncbi:AtpZ/AtpI family protein [Devosia algicola]|uniref:AtpZ/AtpI family protein n=1 Tax=Devosia algicola TaxID=3026418 RepID=A0ABY7YMI7_9HYPH|nr:AtpZ/AtpI family protein [Devosia algicola]WDR02526.1 AtpZ/AtpI family protein [Devosia algicola]
MPKPVRRRHGRREGSTNVGRAVRLGSEFIAAILVGIGIGFVLDQVLGTRPWIMLVMLLVGFAAGIMNITRAVGEMNKAAPPPPGSDLGPDADDEDER